MLAAAFLLLFLLQKKVKTKKRWLRLARFIPAFISSTKTALNFSFSKIVVNFIR